MNEKSGQNFEKEVSRLLNLIGWEVRLTKKSGDLGADIVGICLDETLVVQCKDWSSSVGYDAIKEIVTAKLLYNATIAVVVAKSEFSRQAMVTAKKLDVLLLNINDLSIGSTLDRTERGQQHRARLAWEKEEQEREASYYRIIDEYKNYESAIEHNDRWEKNKYSRIIKSSIAMCTGISIGIYSQSWIFAFILSIYTWIIWNNSDQPISVPPKPKLPKPNKEFERRPTPDFLKSPSIADADQPHTTPPYFYNTELDALKREVQKIVYDCSKFKYFWEYSEYYDTLNSVTLEAIFRCRLEIISDETAYIFSKLYFAKLSRWFNVHNEPKPSKFIIEHYTRDIKSFMFFEYLEGENDGRLRWWNLFWRDIDYLDKYLDQSKSLGKQFTICANLVLRLYNLKEFSFEKIFEPFNYSNYSFSSKLSYLYDKLKMLEKIYRIQEKGTSETTLTQINNLIKLCEPNHPNFFEISNKYINCQDPIIASCFLYILINKNIFNHIKNKRKFEIYALAYNAYCNYILDLFNIDTEEELINHFTFSTDRETFKKVTTDPDGIDELFEFFDPDLIELSIANNSVNKNKYHKFFYGIANLYGFQSVVNYEKARVVLESLLENTSIKRNREKEDIFNNSIRFHLSYIYENGLGVPIDTERADQLFPRFFY